MTTIEVGIIGVGNMGKNHVRLTRELTDLFALTGVYDPDSTRVESMGLSDIAFSSEADLLDAVDAVVVAAPSSLHKDLALMAAGKGKHLLIEKPIALSAQEAREIVDAYKEVNAVLMVGHVERFNPAICEMEKIISREKIVGIEINRCSPMDLRIGDTDVIYDLMIHDVDILMNAIMPRCDCTHLAAFGKKVYSKSFVDYAQALLQFDDGSIASVVSSRTTEGKIRSIKIHCEQCLVEVDLLTKSICVTRKTQYTFDVGYIPTYSQESIVERVFVPNIEPLKAELQHFANCITQNKESKTSGESAIKSLCALDCIKEAVYA